MGGVHLSVPLIGRSLAIALLLLSGACHRKPESHGNRPKSDAAASNVEVSNGSTLTAAALAPTLAVSVEGLEVMDATGATVRVPFGATTAKAIAAVKPAVGEAEKVFAVQCGGRQVTQHDFTNVTLFFEGDALVSWKAFGAVRMTNGIGEGTPGEDLAAAYPDFHHLPKHRAVDLAEPFAAGPIRGTMRENLVTSIDGGKPLCAE